MSFTGPDEAEKAKAIVFSALKEYFKPPDRDRKRPMAAARLVSQRQAGIACILHSSTLLL
jgi:hypothetical protein